ncbi:hypothetical protein [Nocardioides convexus]|uniref:hypothetical protein n=1 Tax=Nocardioides convexus TaxID=2712224 RepID=UPI00241886BA|nr:hypothetical protein [Nocardioides convexus]
MTDTPDLLAIVASVVDKYDDEFGRPASNAPPAPGVCPGTSRAPSSGSSSVSTGPAGGSPAPRAAAWSPTSATPARGSRCVRTWTHCPCRT